DLSAEMVESGLARGRSLEFDMVIHDMLTKK
ncbi:MAG: hypothetical protein ACI9MF_002917, partial [Gammaproteobacteria bacterium]